MCLYPVTFNDNQVACRQCDECYAADINGWVVRCMAERAVAGHMLAITLTYSDLPDGSKPIGATVFNYKDIQNALKVIRESYKDFYGKRGEIRYVVCGERGSKGTQRMHWHMLLFTDKPIGLLGKWTDFYTKEIVEVPEMETNYNWSLWGHGHIRLQQPDHKGVYYALKYAFKDRNTALKSKGTSRYALSENWGASMFRMSKKPPIGLRFLIEYFDRHQSLPAVPPSLKISIPEYTGYWYPTGKLREYALTRCYQINGEYYDQTGKNLPQWASLIKSVEMADENLPNKAKELLQYGPIEEEQTTELENQRHVQHFAAQLAEKQRTAASRATLKQCGHIRPCKECSLHWTPEENAELLREENYWFDKWAEKYTKPITATTIAEFRLWWLGKYRPSRGCKKRNEDEVFQAFRSAKALKKLSRASIGAASERQGRNSPGKRPAPHTIDARRKPKL